MSTRTRVRELTEHIGEHVTIKGFVERVREHKSVQFVVIRDGSGSVQATHVKSKSHVLKEAIGRLSLESAVIISGKVVEAPQVNLGGIEIILESLEVVNLAEPLPIGPRASLEARMDHRQVSLRSAESQLIMRVQTTLEQAMREFWIARGLVELHSPKLLSTASESGAELFSLPYFGRTAYLAQSPQFYKQLAIAGGCEGVFEIGPVFRANPSHTSRHDTEFTSVDIELAWVESHETVMRFEEQWLAHILGAVARRHGTEIEQTFGTKLIVPSPPFPRITLSEARKLLAERGHKIAEKADLDPEGERMLSRYIAEKFGHEFVFVTEYPSDVRAFYHMRFPGTKVTKSFDLLWKGLEITTGAQREHRPQILMQQAEERGFALAPLEHYFGFFKYGCPPHGGFGVGLTRLLMCITGLGNVREVTFLYRGMNRLTP
jgi:aspartyl-tRNA synthetase